LTISAVYDDLTFDNVAVIADVLMDKSYLEITIELIYNQFKNAATQIVQTGFLPLAVQSDLTASVGDYILNRPKKRL
jgi:F-type H+-transporting ATPase subunit gamma